MGDLRVKVVSVSEAGQRIESATQFLETQGRYIKVRVELENLSTTQAGFRNPELRDNKDRGFTRLTTLSVIGFIPENENCLDNEALSPNIPITCQYIFEVAKDAAGLSMSADSGTESQWIDIER